MTTEGLPPPVRKGSSPFDPTSFQPILARTRTIYRPVGPLAYDCIKIVVVRDGSAILFGEFGEAPINVGDVLLLSANTLCGSQPEGRITVTTLYLDTDYVLDQLFWQYGALLPHRLDAGGFVKTFYSEPAQLMTIGEDRAGLLMPWLDELVALSIRRDFQKHFHRMQALGFAVADVVAPFIRTSPVRQTATQRARSRPTLPRSRRFAPLRREAVQVRNLLSGSIETTWTLEDLASLVHLSTKQVSRIFVETYGKTPLAYLTMLRVEEMARLLRETDITVAESARRVGWSSRSRASEAFLECAGVTPSRVSPIAWWHS